MKERPSQPPPRRASSYIHTVSLGLVLIGGALAWNFVALIVSSHGPCTDAEIRDAIQLFMAAAGLVAGVVAVYAAASGTRWRRVAWAASAEALLFALWFVQVFAICPG